MKKSFGEHFQKKSKMTGDDSLSVSEETWLQCVRMLHSVTELEHNTRLERHEEKQRD